MSMPTDPSQVYIWFDAEFTSLDLDHAELLQVAAIVTDGQLKRSRPVEEDVNVFVRRSEGQEVSAWVRENLPDLLEQCVSPGAMAIDAVDERLSQYVDSAVGPPSASISERPVLAGNSIHNDWCLIRRLLPRFAERLNYRFLDVTAIKLIWLNWYKGDEFDKERVDRIKEFFPGATADLTAAPHDAYFDVHASIAELGYYQSKLKIMP